MSLELTIEDAVASYDFMAGEAPLCAAFDAARSLLASAMRSPTAQHHVDVLDLRGAAPMLTARLETLDKLPRSLGFFPDGRLICSTRPVVIAALDGAAQEQAALPAFDVVCTRADGSALLHRERLVMWEGGQLREFEDQHASGATSVDISPDGKFAVSAGIEPYVRLWDVASGAQLKRVKIGHSGASYYAQFAPDGSVLACGGDGKAAEAKWVRLLNVDKRWSERAKLVLPSTLQVFGLGFSASGDRLWASQHDIGRSEGVITVWDWRAGVCLHTIKIAPGAARQYARHVAMSADGARVFVTLPEPAARVVVFDVM